MRTSPLDSLQEITPKAYITCPHLMFARRTANSSEVRGLSAKNVLQPFGKWLR
jgi:hypothetical protein